MAGLAEHISEHALELNVSGLVQGVGFRPFVYNLATRLKLCGWALNRNDGVQIRIQGEPAALAHFVRQLREQAPPLAQIETIRTTPAAPEPLTDFTILHSHSHSNDITRVSPDVAVCQACLEDMRRQANRRNYPFVNCTHCGPRFSIIEDLPYDRQRTTMKAFRMCPFCQAEYEDIRDRRFHAQPNACRECGPRYELRLEGQIISDIDRILEHVCALLERGRIVAIKGVGGFHLACDAFNQPAAAELRRRKQREAKPFAVMFRDLEAAGQYARISEREADLLRSAKRPIVLLEQIRELAPSVAYGLATLGVMLPYTPFHYLLFERLRLAAIVLTSGNLSDEPIVIANDEAEQKLGGAADALLVYNRDIHNRCDDSVAMVVNDRPRLLRRSRGYAPEPIALPWTVEGIVASGAELKTCFCVGKGRQAILSQHIGDLTNYETYAFYQEALTCFTRLFRVEPQVIACDLHPDYLSTRLAHQSGLPTIAVQHHHAHIAAGMAEHGLDEPVIGVSFDGTGLGDDGRIWGGEFLVGDLRGYTRFSHLAYVPMPGGDKAAREPWRMGVAYLYQTFGRALLDEDLPVLRTLPRRQLDLLLTAIEKGINCPQTSSVGRLFDAVAALLNLVTVARFEAEAPMRLESLITPTEAQYGYEIGDTIQATALIAELVQDVERQTPAGVIAAKFHNTLVDMISAMAERIRAASGISTVVLSGGVFQNRYVLGRAEAALTKQGFTVYSPVSVPANDGGLCLGQLAVAAKRRS
jgi:hydrogenase maturation protein HypF